MLPNEGGKPLSLGALKRGGTMKVKNKTLFVLLVCLVLILSACKGSDNSSVGGPGGSTSPSGGPVSTTIGGGEDASSNFFYFSYDDSASTAGVELVKYQLNHDILPPASLGRPWEFLNYETFDTSNSAPTGTFRVSLGLLQRPGEAAETAEYRLGVSVSSPEITRADRQNVVLTLIVDVSGSMGWLTTQVDDTALTKLEVVKYGLNQLAASLKDGDVLNLVTFTTSAAIVLQNVPYSQIATLFIPAVNALTPQASTNLNDGIQKGYQAAFNTFDQAKLNRVVIITDAYANQGEVNSTAIAQNTRINEAEGIYFSGIGMGADFNEAFLNELTEAGKGGYFAVITNHDAKKAFQDRFISLVSVAARHVQFRLDYPKSLTHITTASEESSTVQTAVKPTDFSFNTSQYFYEVFTGLTQTDLSQTFTLTITYTDPGTLQPTTETVTKTLGELLGHEENNIRDAEIIFLFAELLGERTTWDDVNAIVSNFYQGYSSPLFVEYTGLLNKYHTLKGTSSPQ